ncbi:LAMI_0F04104g1_1 [Lachancea mirantina]|uniref:LAMI_0F04104g1_1 n=1 Tax=Lachancea mirantina TaxID=1230905 RepID=A0A1G4JXL7_9SACH|nr:LAMI_0F04104g1_1 [Lachancea mirantina]
MDFETVLYDLKPILDLGQNAGPIDQDSLARSIATLGTVAVAAREPENRNYIGQSGVLQKLVLALGWTLKVVFTGLELPGGLQKEDLIELVSELVRCIANCVADIDENREIVVSAGTDLFDSQIPNALLMADSEVRMKLMVLLKNLCIGNEEYTKMCALSCTRPMIAVLEELFRGDLRATDWDHVFVALDILVDFAKYSYLEFSLPDFALLVSVLRSAVFSLKPKSADDNDEDEDAFSESLQLLTDVLEIVSSQNEKLNFSDVTLTFKVLDDLFSILERAQLEETYENKLIILRRLVSIIGYISSNPSSTNLLEREIAYKAIHKDSPGYTLAAAMILLSNSIASRSDVDEITSHINFRKIIENAVKLKDAVQLQGFLDISKKLLNPDSVLELRPEDLQLLFVSLKTANDQCTYYQNLTPLIEALESKLAALLSGSKLRLALADDNWRSVVLANSGTPVCLILGKLAISSQEVDPKIADELWASAFRPTKPGFQSQTVSPEYLFHLFKAVGLYLHRQKEMTLNLFIQQYAMEIYNVLDTARTLQQRNDAASAGILNNATYVAGLLLEVLRQRTLSSDEEKLHDCAEKLLKKQKIQV